MEMEDKESTDSGSLGGNSEYDSPPSSGGGAYGGQLGGVGGGVPVVPEIVNLAVNMEKNAGILTSPAVAACGGVVGVMGGRTISTGGVSGGVVGDGAVAGSGELGMGKKKRGRPRKYDADGNLKPGCVKTPRVPAAQPGFTLSTPPSYEYSSGSKRGRGKPEGSGNWQVLASLGELFTSTAGGDFTPHVVTVNTGEDVAGKILMFAQKGSRGICVLSANGSVSNVTIRQPGSSGGLLTYEGRFEILTLTGSYTISETCGMRSRSGGLSVSLASPDGRVIGGGIAGLLMAASPIQVVVGTFLTSGFKPQKRRHQTEQPRMSPSVQHAAPANVTAAIPISQAAPEIHTYPVPTTQVPIQTQGGEAYNSSLLSNRDPPNSASTDTSDWNGSGPSSDQRPSPDINISVSLEEN